MLIPKPNKVAKRTILGKVEKLDAPEAEEAEAAQAPKRRRVRRNEEAKAEESAE